MTWKEEYRTILQCRSKKDKIAIAIDCDLMPVGDLNVVTELVAQGYMVWIDRTVLPIAVVQEDQIRFGMNVDVYMLTLKGIKLCNDHGVPQQ